MKAFLFVSLIFLILSPQLSMAQGNGNNGSDKKAQVEAIAQEQGIDLSTHEGRKTMADYLHKTGQQSLLPPRRGHRSEGGSFQSQNNQGGDSSKRREGSRPHLRGQNQR